MSAFSQKMRYNNVLCYRILGIAAAVICLAVLVMSFLRPKETYKTYDINVYTEDATIIPLALSKGSVASFCYETDKAVSGISPCLKWEGEDYPEGNVTMLVKGNRPAGEEYTYTLNVPINSELRESYSYTEFPDGEKLTGNLTLSFVYSGEGEVFLQCTDTDPDGGNNMFPLLSFAEKVSTYPLVFDARTILLMAILVLLVLPKGRHFAYERIKETGYKAERLFIPIVLIAGLLLIILTGTNQLSFDEQIHFGKAWNLSYVGEVYDTEASLRAKTLQIPTFSSLEEKRIITDELNAQNDYDKASIFSKSKMITYDERAYIPSALFLALSRLLHLPFSVQYAVGKIGNLLLYVLICALAIKKAKVGKSIVAMAALIPTSIFTASSYSYDPVVNCFLILGVTLAVNEIMSNDRIAPGRLIASLSCFVIGSYSKQIYIFLALIYFFMGDKKFPGKVRAYLFRLVLLVFCAFMMYEVVAPSYSLSSAANTIAHAGDTRVEGTSMAGQLEYILSNFGSYLVMLLKEMGVRLVSWFSGSYPFNVYGYLGMGSLITTLVWFVLFLFSSVFSPGREGRRDIGLKFRIVFSVMIIGMTMLIWTVLYMSFNPVGAPSIGGVQDRYFAPLFLSFGVILMNSKFYWKKDPKFYYYIIYGISFALLLYFDVKFALLPFYFG